MHCLPLKLYPSVWDYPSILDQAPTTNHVRSVENRTSNCYTVSLSYRNPHVGMRMRGEDACNVAYHLKIKKKKKIIVFFTRVLNEILETTLKLSLKCLRVSHTSGKVITRYP